MAQLACMFMFAFMFAFAFALRLPSGVIDTHCHLTFPEFREDIARTMSEAHAAGVSGCITISTTAPDAVMALRIARSRPDVWSTAGIHPLYSDQGPHDWKAIKACIAEPRCVGWGELGLDNHHGRPAKDVQLSVLMEHLEVIRSVDAIGAAANVGAMKPIVIHCREAFAELIPVLRESGIDASRFVFHCFTGSVDDMRMLLDFGAMVSFTGVITYKNAQSVRDAAVLAPSDRIMVETDAPFLSPEPLRAKRPCTPAMVRVTAEALAVVRGVGFETLHRQVNENTRRFFGIELG